MAYWLGLSGMKAVPARVRSLRGAGVAPDTGRMKSAMAGAARMTSLEMAFGATMARMPGSSVTGISAAIASMYLYW